MADKVSMFMCYRRQDVDIHFDVAQNILSQTVYGWRSAVRSFRLTRYDLWISLRFLYFLERMHLSQKHLKAGWFSK